MGVGSVSRHPLTPAIPCFNQGRPCWLPVRTLGTRTPGGTRDTALVYHICFL